MLAYGLDSPRKLNFDPSGALYVAEVGRGGTGASIPSPSLPGASLFYGATGAITRIQNGVVERVVTGLPSLAFPDGSDAAGVNDIEFDAYGNAYVIVGLASNPANRNNLLKIPDFSQLIEINSFDNGGSWTLLRDFGALYVGELTGFPFQTGTAKVYHINNEGKPEVYAGGFTNISDIAFDKFGGLYVLEYDADGMLNGSDAGALIYVSPDGKTRATIADDKLINPTAIEIAPNGDIYISNKGFVAGQGEVLHLKMDNPFNPQYIPSKSNLCSQL